MPNIALADSELYVDLKNSLNLENLITIESVDPYSPFYIETHCIIVVFIGSNSGKDKI